MSTPDLTYKQFIAYLLLFAANADLEIKDEEVAHIKSKVGPEDFDTAYKHFTEANDAQVISHIMDYKEKYYPTTAERDSLLEEVTAVFSSDKDYSALEKEMMTVIRKLL